MRTIVFELCAESIQACVAAREGGADRIELCSALDEGGLTPSHGMVLEAMARTGLPIHVMLRPRGGDFVYTDDEFAVMERDLAHVRQLGVSGVVLGLLRADGTVDMERTAYLARAAAPLEVTFHRAFDEVEDLRQGLEDVIRTGCHRVLTSGGEADAMAGAVSLGQLVLQAARLIEIAVGGGLRLDNAAELARTTGARHFHGSMRRFVGDSNQEKQPEGTRPEGTLPMTTAKTYVDANDVRAVIRDLSRSDGVEGKAKA